MATTWYFDGAGTGAECRIMVLSGVGASDEVWQSFNEDWGAALHEIGIKNWHSTDFFRRRDGVPRLDVPSALLNVVGQQTSREFSSVSFALDKAAASIARSEHPEVVPPGEEILMSLCFGGLGVAKEDINQGGRLRVLFDRNEPFIHHLKSAWQAGRTRLRRAREGGWPIQIREIEPARSTDHPGLQAADLLSWAIRSRYEYGDKLIDPKVFLILFPFATAGKLRGGLLDENAIRSLYIDKVMPELKHGYRFI
ncbi:MAG: DUF3800 domain-containing protein [Bryobacteraceae bacterium]